MKIPSSLSEFANLIPDNFEGFQNAYPKLSTAAEAVHQGLEIFGECVKLDSSDPSMYMSGFLQFGSHSAWAEAYFLATGGHLATSWAAMRRSIEYACYAAKISTSPRRAKAWISQRTDKKARSTFAASCQIPFSFISEKYSVLRPLLVAYNTANYFGAHGNFESLLANYNEVKDGNLLFAFQSNKEYVPGQVSLFILLGYRLLQSYRQFMEPAIFDKTKLDKVMSFVSETIRDARLDQAKHKYGENIPEHVFKAICIDDQGAIESMFQEYIDAEQR